MDILSLNYRQLQTEAKNYGIKANQKIEILRLKVLEAVQSSKCVNNRDSKNSNELDLSTFSENQTEFITNINKNNISTPNSNKLETNLIQNLESSSMDDIDKILGSNQRNSQFFDDVLNFSNKDISKSFIKNDESIIENIDPITKFDDSYKCVISENISELDDNLLIRKRKLNTTFEMTEADLKNSKLTVEQRKQATMENTKMEKSIPKFTEPIFRNKSNLQSKFLIKKKELCSINETKVDQSKIKTLYKKDRDSIAFKRPINVNKNISNIANPTEYKRNSIHISKIVTSNPIYQKKTTRTSIIPSSKPNRQTITGRFSSPKPLWK